MVDQNTAVEQSMVDVSQCDRDAAADVIKSYRQNKDADWQGRVRTGQADYGYIVQAFARHRTRALEATQSPDEEALGEALFNLSARLKDAGFLDDDANHAAYEVVVSAFAALSTPSRIEAGEGSATLMAFARIWWQRKMPDSRFVSAEINGDGRVNVHWADHEEKGKYTLPIDFLSEVLATSPTEPAQADLLAEALEALRKCMDQFLFYETSHRAKGTSDGYAKADTNRQMADMCDAILAKGERSK